MPKATSREGFARIPNSLARCGKLTPKAMSIYVCLKSHAGTTNRTWLSHRTIANESNNSKSAVKSGLNELKRAGLVTWKGRIRTTDGRQTSNDYFIRDSESVIRGLLGTTPQVSVNYQVEEPIKEELLNSSSKGRANKRNRPSDEMPATSKQIKLLTEIFCELGSNIENELSIDEIESMSRLGADVLIHELKVAKWREEHFGRRKGGWGTTPTPQ